MTTDGALRFEVRIATNANAKVADLTFDVAHPTSISVIERLWVQPSFQRRGVGAALYRFVNSIQRKCHGTPFTSCIVDPTRDGLGFWTKQGYALHSEDRLIQLGTNRPHYHEQHLHEGPRRGQLGSLAMSCTKV